MATLDAAVLNKMIGSRIREGAKGRSGSPDAEMAIKLRRSAGLQPLPPRTALDTQSFGEVVGEGFSVRKFVYFSRPGFAVPALLYVPTGSSSSAIVLASDTWAEGKGHVCAQSFAIAMALHGIATLVIEPPGTWYEGVVTERGSQGEAWEPLLRLGSPALGVYAWDLIRGQDWLIENGFGKVGLMGVGHGAEAGYLAFLLDDRFAAFGSANALGSHERTSRFPESLAQCAGIAEYGDVWEWTAARQPAPMMLLACDGDTLHTPEAVQLTSNRCLEAFQRRGSGASVRFARYLGEPDLNRRMRETAAAFFLEHLVGHAFVEYVAEPRPLTDGRVRPSVSGTFDPGQLLVFGSASGGQAGVYTHENVNPVTLTDLCLKSLSEPYPEVVPELVPWGKYGKVEAPSVTETLRLTDAAPDSQAISCPSKELDYDGLCALGLSGSEFVAQVLHLCLPEGPEGYESTAAGSDGLKAVFKSVRTMVTKETPPTGPTRVEATGLFASEVAICLARLRPSIEVVGEEVPTAALDRAQVGGSTLIVPGARYRK